MTTQPFLDRNTLQIVNLYKLSPGEEFVLQQMGNGLTTQEIALFKGKVRSVKTIEAYMDSIKKKLQILSIQKLRHFAVCLNCYCEFTGTKPVIVTTSAVQFDNATIVAVAKRIIN